MGGGATGYPQQRSRRIPHVDNVQRELLELSYDILPEDAPRFEKAPSDQLSPRETAMREYSGFSEKEKIALLDQKIEMLERKLKSNDKVGNVDRISTKLLDELRNVRLAMEEGDIVRPMKEAA